MKRIYLNFVSADYRTAVQISQYIEASFDDYVTDSAQDKPDWDATAQAIANTDIMLYLISPDAIQDAQWQRQLDEALRSNIPVQGLLVRDTQAIFPALGFRLPIDLSQGITDMHLRELNNSLQTFQPFRLPLFRDWRQLTVAVLIALFVLVVLTMLFYPSESQSPLPTLTPP
ncbi:MAG: toll/interleukin-1 receptor domain-containing protein [Chloroflexi bacterium]|nr:toll/interleukin-1 receptor domain-containing protein [Chloroflexota bacterium]